MGTPETAIPDEFEALEERVMRAVETVRREREARAAAEAETADLRQRVKEQAGTIETCEREREAAAERTQATEDELVTLRNERNEVRQRIEKMLHQMDELV